MEWQSIETAPKDGTWIAALCDYPESPVTCKFVQFEQYNGNIVEYWELPYESDYCEKTCEPKYWHPIPQGKP